MPARILVVDDEPDLEQLVRQRFRKEIKHKEYEFLFAHNGVEALEKLKKEMDIDIVLCDINMPIMDGLTLISKLNEIGSLRKSIMVSAYGDMENIRAAMNRGAYDFVTKPIDFQDLEATIQKAVKEIEALKSAALARKENERKRKLLEAENARKTQELERTQETIKIQEQLMVQEKMASLGTLTAGVAHELNNPASAAQRGSQQLLEVFTKLKQTQTKLYQLNLSSEQHKLLLELEQQIQEHADVPIEMDAVTRSDLECKLETVLDDLGVEDAWDLAPTLVNLGYDAERLASLAEKFAPSQLATVMKWLSETHPIYSLLSEISQGTTRISEIVRALRTYSYFDHAPVLDVDVHEGLENTLIVLRHKLKAGITVNRYYSKDLPKIEAYGSELNQVWTNIIDNAIGAMDGKGELALRTYQEDQKIAVEIEDNGRGIPTEMQSQLFDPFFTTKPQGEGTGLGLHISHNIVQKHHGEIKVTSKPGSTCFVVKLPIVFEDTD